MAVVTSEPDRIPARRWSMRPGHACCNRRYRDSRCLRTYPKPAKPIAPTARAARTGIGMSHATTAPVTKATSEAVTINIAGLTRGCPASESNRSNFPVRRRRAPGRTPAGILFWEAKRVSTINQRPAPIPTPSSAAVTIVTPAKPVPVNHCGSRNWWLRRLGRPLRCPWDG